MRGGLAANTELTNGMLSSSSDSTFGLFRFGGDVIVGVSFFTTLGVAVSFFGMGVVTSFFTGGVDGVASFLSVGV